MKAFFHSSLFIIFTILFLLSALPACGGDDDDDNDAAAPADQAPPDNPDPYTGPDDDTSDQGAFLGHDKTEEHLIRLFAPLVIQRLPAAPPIYNPWADHPGQVSLSAETGEYPYQVTVDWNVRVIYATARQVRLGDTEHYQLYYYLFYSERPVSVSPEDNPLAYYWQFLESGPIDAKVMRVTLDGDATEPLLLEVANLTGGEYLLFVTHQVEAALIEEFAAQGLEYPGVARPEGPGVRSVEVLPVNVAGAFWRPSYAFADGFDNGFHRALGAWTSYEQYYFYADPPLQIGVLYTDPDWYIFDPRSLYRTDYILRPFEELYDLSPAGSDQPIGIFDQWQMIWNAYTPLARVFYELNVPIFPGTPRDVEDLWVLEGQLKFQNPELLDKIIFLPTGYF